jgi:chorismate mutase
MTILAIGGNGVEGGQNAIDQLQPLVETSVHRLDIAEQAAFAKWDSKAKVEDAPREAQVIMGAVKEGESAGLDRTFVANFFRAQIEANKVVQYALLADWYRAGGAPAHGPANLTTGIRPKLDRLQTAVRRRSECCNPRKRRNTAAIGRGSLLSGWISNPGNVARLPAGGRAPK